MSKHQHDKRSPSDGVHGAAATAVPQGSFGRLLFSRGPRRLLWLWLLLMGLGGASLTGIMVASGVLGLPPETFDVLDLEPVARLGTFKPVGLFAILLFGVFVSQVVLGAANLWSKSQFHQNGISRRGMLGTRTVLYASLDSFAYREVRLYVDAQHDGNHIKMRFTPQHGKPITCKLWVQGRDVDLEHVRTSVSEAVADKMHAELERTGRVTWLIGIEIASEMIHFPIGNRESDKEQQTTALHTDVRYHIEAGYCHIKVRNRPHLAFSIPCGGENFFPGLCLLLRLGVDAGQNGEREAPQERAPFESAQDSIEDAEDAEDAEDGDVSCPACGTVGELVSGACSDCGLYLGI